MIEPAKTVSARHAYLSRRRHSRGFLYDMKTKILALFLAVPFTWIALSVSDNVTVPDSVRYILSPGTMLGLHVSMQPTHSWHEMADRLNQWFAIAFFTDMAFYTMLIFGVATVTRALKKPK